jgi:beta-phosphoglucomutase-like phosphatase (HAD superfamily)
MPNESHSSGQHHPSGDVPALLFDLDCTLVDSVHEHVLAWNEALQAEGIRYPSWNISSARGNGRRHILEIAAPRNWRGCK